MWDSIVSAIQGIISLPNDAGKAAGILGEAWATITDFRMWRSLGWLLLGILLIVLGFVIWNRQALGQAATVLAESA